VSAVSGYEPSLSEADALVARRLATARTRHIAIDVRVDGDEITGRAGDRPFRGWVGLIGALDHLLENPTTD
jgi:hypothetical protein